MAISKTMQAARAVIKKTGRGTKIFNDRLADGTRSLKVWGWTADDYALAEGLLQQQGCQTAIKQFFTTYHSHKKLVTRILVSE